MADRPILFSGPMVRALLAGTKTQTRRLLNPQPSATQDIGLILAENPPRIKVGDRLYVRESWNWTHIKDLAPGETLGRTAAECSEANGGFACPCGDGIVYAATNAHEHPVHGKARWKPSLHMPRWASRITLTVTDVRVQRLQDISEDDAEAEGIDDAWLVAHHVPPPRVSAYRDLWSDINGPGSWDANPWVAAYTFSVEHRNVDAPREALAA